jgi:hypothetical protein
LPYFGGVVIGEHKLPMKPGGQSKKSFMINVELSVKALSSDCVRWVNEEVSFVIVNVLL